MKKRTKKVKRPRMGKPEAGKPSPCVGAIAKNHRIALVADANFKRVWENNPILKNDILKHAVCLSKRARSFFLSAFENIHTMWLSVSLLEEAINCHQKKDLKTIA